MSVLINTERHYVVFKVLSVYWFKHVSFRRKGLGTAYNANSPLQKCLLLNNIHC